MTWTIRRFGVAAVTVLAVAVGTASACRAQCTNPDCLYIFVVPYPPGGATDVMARLVGQSLEKRLGWKVVIENRPGAAGSIAAQSVARAKPDGSTLLVFDSSAAIGATLYKGDGFDPLRDVAPIASVASVPSVVVANPSLPVKTASELVAYAKANPGKIKVASSGIGSQSHLSAELFKATAGIDIVQVPYRGGGPALTDLLADHVQMSFLPITAAIAPIREGKIRALAVTGSKRSDLLPDVPTLGESVPGYAAGGWVGLGAPKGTSPEIIASLNKEINATLADPAVKEQIAKLGASVLADSPAEFGRLIATDTEKWAKVIRAGNIKAQ